MTDTQERLFRPSELWADLGVDPDAFPEDVEFLEPNDEPIWSSADDDAAFSAVTGLLGAGTSEPKPYVPLADQCVRPIVLSSLALHDQGSQRLVLPCGTRREDKCAPCAAAYQDILRRSVQEGMPSAAAGDGGIVLFVTLTQPSFGAVHRYDWTRKDTAKLAAKHNLSSTSEEWLSSHDARGFQVLCVKRNAALAHIPKDRRLIEGDPRADSLVGTPVDPSTYDFAGQVLHNRMAADLIARTSPYLRSRLRFYEDFGCTVSIKILAEFQKRGALHFHCIIAVRPPTDPGPYVDMRPGSRRLWKMGDMVPAPGVDEWQDFLFLYRRDKAGRVWCHPILHWAHQDFSPATVKKHFEDGWGPGPSAAVPAEVAHSITAYADPLRPAIRQAALGCLTSPNAQVYLPDTATYPVPDRISWGSNVDIRVVATHDTDRDGDHRNSAQRLGAYVAKYVSKAAGAAGSALAGSKGARFLHLYRLRLETLAQTATLTWLKCLASAERSTQSRVDRLQESYTSMPDSADEAAFQSALAWAASHSAHERSTYFTHTAQSFAWMDAVLSTVRFGGPDPLAFDLLDEADRDLQGVPFESVRQNYRDTGDAVVDYFTENAREKFGQVSAASLHRAGLIDDAMVDDWLSVLERGERAVASWSPTPPKPWDLGDPLRATAPATPPLPFDAHLLSKVTDLPSGLRERVRPLLTTSGLSQAWAEYAMRRAASAFQDQMDDAQGFVVAARTVHASNRAAVLSLGYAPAISTAVTLLAKPSGINRPLREVMANPEEYFPDFGHLSPWFRFRSEIEKLMDFAGHSGGVNYSSRWPVSMSEIRARRAAWAADNSPSLTPASDDDVQPVWYLDLEKTGDLRQTRHQFSPGP
ncbi:hypothetical protein nbrc107696_42680 [Gordonia spumicola]|uniref:Replication initiation protein n=1 Tax=Gordonia spumicola TaxID=589161 RepID=A0A7I9VF31_9ACTN|nr:replication initiator [Gordonia spumicola]GEE03822.1 hypothetical protein nbrc107696_42680 [Gordonia spumicola]